MKCCAPLHEECPKHHGHKENSKITPRTCATIAERAQVIIMWMKAAGVRNASPHME